MSASDLFSASTNGMRSSISRTEVVEDAIAVAQRDDRHRAERVGDFLDRGELCVAPGWFARRRVILSARYRTARWSFSSPIASPRRRSRRVPGSICTATWLRGLHRHPRPALGPHDHERAQQQGLAVRDTDSWSRSQYPVGPQVGSESGDPQPLGQRGHRQPRNIGCHQTEPVAQRRLGLRGQERQRLVPGVIAVQLGVAACGLVERLK